MILELLSIALDIVRTARRSRDPLQVMRRVQAHTLAISLEHGYPAPEPKGQR